MLGRVYFGLLLMASVPAWAQVAPDASGGSPDESQMSMPAQVSGRAYPMTFGAAERSNYLMGGVIFTAAYDDNIEVGGITNGSAQTSQSIYPTLEYRRSTPRETSSIDYGAGFTLYQPTSALNMASQNASVDFDYRLSRHSSLSIQDSFIQNSNILSQPYTLTGTSVSGSTLTPQDLVIVPYANQWGNSTRAELGYQFTRDAMIGGAGSYSVFRYPDPTQVTGLNNSDSAAAQGFYTRRMSREQYLGVIYQYSRTTTNPIDTTTNSQVISILYSLMPSHRFSLSVTVGPQFVNVQEVGYPETSSIGTFVSAGVHWNGVHTSAAATYSRSVTTGQGLVGAYQSDAFNMSVRRRLTRLWDAGISGSYLNLANTLPVSGSTTAGGHMLFGTISVVRSLGEHMQIEADYRRLHQSYPGVDAISGATDDDRVSVAFSYHFTRPVGR